MANPISTEPPPADLLSRDQWVRWRYEVRKGKPTKPPVHVTENRGASHSDPSTWGSYQIALDGVGRHNTEGVGCVFAKDDPYTGVDLDDCRDPETGILEPWAQEIVDLLASYTEVSPSGTGVKIWVRGKLKVSGRRKGQVGVYSWNRFFTYTGQHFPGTPTTINERQAELDRFMAEQFPEKKAKKQKGNPGPGTTSKTSKGTFDEEQRLKAMLAKSDKARRLWEGDTSGYPSMSEAVAALLCHLAFWTNRDPAKMDRFFRRSGLHCDHWAGEDGKWVRLGEREIDSALEQVKDGYEPRVESKGEKPPPPTDEDMPPEFQGGNASKSPPQEGAPLPENEDASADRVGTDDTDPIDSEPGGPRDPLDAFDDLVPKPLPETLDGVLRAFADIAKTLDPLALAMARETAIVRLRSLGLKSPAKLVDAALTQAAADNPKRAGKKRGSARPHGAAPQDPITVPDGDAPKPLLCTEAHNAQRLVNRHGQDIRYLAPSKKWLVWDGRRWATDDRIRIVELAKDTARHIFNEAAKARTPDIAEHLSKWAIRSLSRQNLEATIALARSLRPVLTEDLDRDPWLLSVQNGTLDLRTGKLRRHRRQDLITKLAPVAYDPAATCPRWVAFLDRILASNAELIRFVQRVVGYSLTGDIGEECLFLLYGTGANGKTKFLETLRALLGDYAAQADFSAFLEKQNSDSPRNGLARLRGSRLASAVEPKQGTAFAEDVIKLVTGGDTITARFLYAEFFEFRPEFKLFLAANHKPRVRGHDEGIWRRIQLIPFTVRIPKPERDKNLLRKLSAELPGILNWAIKGCLAWQAVGLSPPAEVTEANEAYRVEEDVIVPFLDLHCYLGPAAWATAGDLYGAYIKHCEQARERPVSQKRFGGLLASHGLTRRKVHGTYRWEGVGLVGDHGDHQDHYPKTFSIHTRAGEVSEKRSPSSPSSPQPKKEVLV